MRWVAASVARPLAFPIAIVDVLFLYGDAHERAMTACTTSPPSHESLPGLGVTVESSFPPWKFDCVYWKGGKIVAKTRASWP